MTPQQQSVIDAAIRLADSKWTEFDNHRIAAVSLGMMEDLANAVDEMRKEDTDERT